MTDEQRRRYVSPGRRARAEATRARILDAATDLFLADGYAGTTTAAVARAAGVSEAAVFAAFGSKAALLVAVVTANASGPQGELPPAPSRDWSALTPAEVLRAFAGIARRAHGRSWRLLTIARAAAEGDPVLSPLVAAAGRRRRPTCLWLMGDVLGVDAAALDSATDRLWTLTSVDVYRLLVIELGWSADRYEIWLGQLLCREFDVAAEPGPAS